MSSVRGRRFKGKGNRKFRRAGTRFFLIFVRKVQETRYLIRVEWFYREGTRGFDCVKRQIGVTKIAPICRLTSGGMAKVIGFLAGVPFPSSSRHVLYYFPLSFKILPQKLLQGIIAVSNSSYVGGNREGWHTRGAQYIYRVWCPCLSFSFKNILVCAGY